MKAFKKYALILLALLICLAALAVLLVIYVKTPKFRLASVTVNNLSFTNTANSASFDISLEADYAVRNPNFFPFEYRSSEVAFSYRGKTVGKGLVGEGKATPLSTKEGGLGVRLSSRAFSAGSGLGRDIGNGRVSLSVGSELRGKVDFVKMMKRSRTPEMSCTMVVNLADKVVQNLKCD